MNTRDLGTHFEDLALAWLLECGMHFLDRNVHFKEGELDLIMQDKHGIVFVEVKGRRGHSMGPLANALTPKKIQRMKRAIWKWRDQTGNRLPGRMLFVGVQEIRGQARFSSYWIE